VGNVFFRVFSEFCFAGSAKMQEFQIKTSDGSTVDILIKPLVSGLVVKKVLTKPRGKKDFVMLFEGSRIGWREEQRQRS
jgi:hypothetical protein